jgi:hypothetical protein
LRLFTLGAGFAVATIGSIPTACDGSRETSLDL